jgi:hypothetical protein
VAGDGGSVEMANIPLVDLSFFVVFVVFSKLAGNSPPLDGRRSDGMIASL